MALNHIANEPPPLNYIIFSDSRSVLQAIASASTTNPLIADITMQLQAMATYSNIIFCWIPSHVGIAGNESADQAAKTALSLPDSPLAIPYSDLRPNIQQWVINNWQQLWDQSNAKLHQIQPQVSIKHTHNSGLRRRDQTIISRLRIGHTRLTHNTPARRRRSTHLHPMPVTTHRRAYLDRVRRLPASKRQTLHSTKHPGTLHQTTALGHPEFPERNPALQQDLDLSNCSTSTAQPNAQSACL